MTAILTNLAGQRFGHLHGGEDATARLLHQRRLLEVPMHLRAGWRWSSAVQLLHGRKILWPVSAIRRPVR